MYEADDKCNKNLAEEVRTICRIIKTYYTLLKPFVMNFFIDNTWDAVPEDWRSYLENMPMERLSTLLDFKIDLLSSKDVPESLRTLREQIRMHSLPRKLDNEQEECFTAPTEFYVRLLERFPDHSKRKFFKTIFHKMKPKKCYEIFTIAKMIDESKQSKKVDFIVDIGSGKGHLVRILAFMYGFSVIAIERNEELYQEAINLDDLLQKKMRYKNLPIHINSEISSDTDVNKFEEMISVSVNNDDFTYGIIGLHPCGDLAPTLLKLYKNSTRCKFINLVSCCYHKLTGMHSEVTSYNQGYPLNNYVPYELMKLNYSLHELACHANEQFVEKVNGDYWNSYDNLQVHAFRAVLQKLIINKYPGTLNIRLNNVKYQHALQFSDYCIRATKDTKYILNSDDINAPEVLEMLKQWKRVVVYYCVRSMFAPLVETLILRDRQLYIGENCTITPVFKANISPRNFVLCASRFI